MTSSNMPTYEDPGAGTDAMDFRKVASMLLARAWIIIICLIISGGITFLYLYRATPRYAATALLAYQTEQLRPLDVTGLLPENASVQYLDSRIRPISRELQSRTFLERVARLNKLASDPRFVSLEPGEQLTDEEAGRMLGRMIDIEVPKNDNIIFVKVEHPNPNMATDLANSMVKELIRQTEEDKETALEKARSQLQNIMGSLQRDWETNESKLQPLRDTASGLTRELNNQLPMLNRLAQSQIEVSLRIIALENSHKQAEQRRGDLGQLLNVDFIAQDPDVILLRRAITERELAFSNLKQRYKEKHPVYIEAEGQLKAARAQLEEAVSTAVNGLQSALDTARKQQEGLQGDFAQSQEATDLLMKQLEKSTNSLLNSEVELQRAILDRVMQRVKEATISGDLFNNPLKIEAEAIVPLNPAKPDKIKVAVLGVFAGLACGVGLALALGFVDTSLKSLEETEQFLNFPVLSAVPRISELETDASQIIMNDEANFSGAEAFRSLRTSISVLHKDKSIKSTLFTSALPEEGKTFCALNFAVALAQQGQRTLLVECDLRRPMVAPALPGVERDHPGVTEYLRLIPVGTGTPVGVTSAPPGGSGLSFAELRRKHEGASVTPTATVESRPEAAVGRPALDDFVQKTAVDNLSFLSSGAPAFDSSELLAQLHALTALMAEAHRKFDRIVIDSAPLLGVSDSLLLATHVQAVCLVIRAHRTARKSVQRALEILQRAQAPVLGIILNGLVATRSDYYSDYYHYEGYRAAKGSSSD